MAVEVEWEEAGRIQGIMEALRKATKNKPKPAAAQIIQIYGPDPFLVLIGCVLSLRTKDTVSLPASLRLFEQAKTPLALLALPVATLEKIMYPVGFYRRKAAGIHELCRVLLERFNGQVPHTFQELINLPGVGPKTANLVLGLGFGIPAICVDTHVHRISNRLGLVKTKNPEQTEKALKMVLPERYWIEYNYLMVIWGQTICVPISPKCSQCAIAPWCPRIGVTRHR